MTRRVVKRLRGLEIDEVSLVDTPANQFGTVEITKANQEGTMSVFDASGEEVFEDELVPGAFVYDTDGNEFLVGDGNTQLDDEQADELDYELESVGKAGGLGRAGQYARLGRAQARRGAGQARRAGQAGLETARGQVGRGVTATRSAASSANTRLGAPAMAWSTRQDSGLQTLDNASRRAAQHVGRNALAYTGGTAATATAGGAGYGASRRSSGKVGKSFVEDLREDLSKAYTDEDRDDVIAKAFEAMGGVLEHTAQLEAQIGEMQDDRQYEEYVDLAKGYGFGDEDEIGGILLRASQFMPEQDVLALDRYFSGAGEIAKGYMQEIGQNGVYDSGDTMGQIYAVAGQAVAKNAELGLTQEQAVTALFAANPDAYDTVLAEQRQR